MPDIMLGSTRAVPLLTEDETALDGQGRCGRPCGAPLATPDADAIDDIKEVLAWAGLLQQGGQRWQ